MNQSRSQSILHRRAPAFFYRSVTPYPGYTQHTWNIVCVFFFCLQNTHFLSCTIHRSCRVRMRWSATYAKWNDFNFWPHFAHVRLSQLHFKCSHIHTTWHILWLLSCHFLLLIIAPAARDQRITLRRLFFFLLRLPYQWTVTGHK